MHYSGDVGKNRKMYGLSAEKRKKIIAYQGLRGFRQFDGKDE